MVVSWQRLRHGLWDRRCHVGELSAGEVAEVPPAVVTVTSTVPLPAGEVAVIEVGRVRGHVAVLAPKWTAVAEPGWCR